MTDDRKRKTGGEVELLPLPGLPNIGAGGQWMGWSDDDMKAYARANVDRALADSRAEVERLREQIKRLMYAAPDGNHCGDFHHGKADQHFEADDCGPMRRWHQALECARAALSLEPNP